MTVDHEGFKYTEGEWRDINASISYAKEIGVIRPRDDDLGWLHSSLCLNAIDYLSSLSLHSDRRRSLKAKWGKIAKLADKLSAELSKIMKDTVDQLDLDSYLVPTGPALLCHPDKAILQLIAHAITLAPDTARGVAEHFNEHQSKNDPHLQYQSQVLQQWKNLGGRLKIARGANGVQGPLARFFFAVARPVMGAHTPSAESLPDIVARAKEKDRDRISSPAIAAAFEQMLNRALVEKNKRLAQGIGRTD